MGITAISCCQHRQTGNDRFDNGRPGIFIVGGLQQQIGAEQKTGHVITATVKFQMIVNTKLAGQAQERSGVTLSYYQQEGVFAS